MALKESDMRQMSFKENCRGIIKHEGQLYAVMTSECKYYVDGRCKIYDRRPEACKTFPKNCEEKWRKVNPLCGMIQDG